MGRYTHRSTLEIFDFTDYVEPIRSRRSPKLEQAAKLKVSDDWPDIVPITEQEVRVIEGHFADLLDELLGPRL